MMIDVSHVLLQISMCSRHWRDICAGGHLHRARARQLAGEAPAWTQMREWIAVLGVCRLVPVLIWELIENPV